MLQELRQHEVAERDAHARERVKEWEKISQLTVITACLNTLVSIELRKGFWGGTKE